MGVVSYLFNLVFECLFAFFAMLAMWNLGFFGGLIFLGLVLIPIVTFPYVLYRLISKKMIKADFLGYLLRTIFYATITLCVGLLLYFYLYQFILYAANSISFIVGLLSAVILTFVVIKYMKSERLKLFDYLFD
jgi:hypothetical protein